MKGIRRREKMLPQTPPAGEVKQRQPPRTGPVVAGRPFRLKSHGRSDVACALFPDKNRVEAGNRVAYDIRHIAQLRREMMDAGYVANAVNYTAQQIGILIKFYKVIEDNE